MKQKVIIFLVGYLISGYCFAQDNAVHKRSSSYQWPADPSVREKLNEWQDLKFGMIIHWGLYAVPGIVESWQICSEPWIKRDSTIAYEDQKKWYFGLKDKFNPIHFNPEQWAQAATDAGMRYLVFTTKHHDGFCMFDTKQTDFRITNGPFASNPRADVARFVFDAFRKHNFMIGAYFSKPDWHSHDYWWPTYATPDRNVNYSIEKFPWRWNRFKNYTYNQISELMHNYGRIDILWLDGGWVHPTVNAKGKTSGQDIDMPRIAQMARQAQPGILIVDRTVPGRYENYQTPEQSIPNNALDTPWESCITLGNNWGWVPNDPLKSPTSVIHTLVQIVAKGGSLLLGVGPRADGTLEPAEITILRQIGSWLKANGDAIYKTRPASVFQSGNTFFTQSKDGHKRYAIIPLPEGKPIPQTVEWSGNLPVKGTKIKLLATQSDVRWKLVGDKVQITLPAAFRKKGSYPALAFTY